MRGRQRLFAVGFTGVSESPHYDGELWSVRK